MGEILNPGVICIIAGFFIAALVSAFKKIPLVAKYPKVVAFMLSALVALVSKQTTVGFDWAMVAECVLVPFATSVASYEVVKTATTDGA